MIRIFKFALLALCFFTVQTSFAGERVYKFTADTYLGFHHPELDLSGDVEGEITARLDTQVAGAVPKPEALTIKFPNAPAIEVSGFYQNHQYPSSSYVAIAKNTWVYRALQVEVEMNDVHIHFRISVMHHDSFVNPAGAATMQPMPMLVNGHGVLEDVTPFKVVDTYETTVDGKTLVLSLHSAFGKNTDPLQGMLGEGFEIKALWYGHGEKLLYLPAPYPGPYPVTPIAIINDPAPPGLEGMISVRYTENHYTGQSAARPLRELLDLAYPPTM